jgi:hypothetical protein
LEIKEVKEEVETRIKYLKVKGQKRK